MKLTSQKAGTLEGDITVPGDKSISHRALMMGALALGTTEIRGLLESEDVIATRGALRAMGVDIEVRDAVHIVRGCGVGGLHAPDNMLDMGNSGTAARLMMGLVAGYDFDVIFTGDESLRSRPMKRVLAPLEEMGVSYSSAEGGRLPITMRGSESLLPISYRLPVASAQVKSAILLAGLYTRGRTTVIEATPTRDHTEKMLRSLGAEVSVDACEDGNHISITGFPQLVARDIYVPADPSSAAFFMVAALITPGSHIVLRNVLMNELRTGVITTLLEMGGDITMTNIRNQAGEELADIEVRYSRLHAVDVPANRAASMIDEYPILSVAAACADGRTVMRGLAELRVKESDRLSAIADGLLACGVRAEEGEDSLIVTGGDVRGTDGGAVVTHMDHRIAMSFLVLGAVSSGGVTVDDGSFIPTSFPNFLELAAQCGLRISEG